MKQTYLRRIGAYFLAALCTIGSSMASAAGAPPAADADTLVLWHFDKVDGQTVAGENGATAAISGGVQATEGKFGQGLRFNGTDGKLTVRHPRMLQIAGDEGCTIEAWVQVTKSGNQPIYSLPPYFEFELRNSTGAVSFNFSSADRAASVRCTGKTNVTTGDWHHIAGVRDAKNKKVRVYVDGELDGEVDDATAGLPIIIGESAFVGSSSNGSETLGGTIDELRISKVARVIEKVQSERAAARQLTLENDHVRFVFNVANARVSLGSLLDKASGVEFVEPSANASNIWQAQVRSAAAGELVVMNESVGKLDVQSSKVDGGKRLDFKWAGLPVADKPGAADVSVSVTLPDDSRMADWRIKLDNRSDTHGLWTAVFPRITNFAKLSNDGKDVIAIPGGNGGGAGEGQAYPDPFKTLTHIFPRTYPCYHQSMQFNAYYNDKAGLYLATHDGKMNLKAYILQPQERTSSASTLAYEVHLYPADAGVAGTGLNQDYPHVVGTFNGDWYDASKIYRKWALEQVWAKKGTLEQRDDISPFIKNGAYWMVGTFEWESSNKPPLREKFRQMSYEEAVKNARVLDVDKSFQQAKSISEYFGFPLLLWTNEWFDGGGDISPPRYIHQRGVPEYMNRVHKELKDVYVSGHMQMKRTSIQLPEFQSNPEWKASVAGKWDGTKHVEALGAMHEDPKDQHAYLCWSTDFWKKFWADKAKSIVTETHLDGFHVDELAVATNFELQCFDASHGHPVGGGTLYADSRRAQTKLLRDSARSVKPTFAIHHEALSEIFIDVADLAEVCTSPSNKNVPMWHAVYHDYNFTMGRRIHPWMDRRTFHENSKEKYGDNDIDQFNASFAQTYVWGNQPGWTRMDIVEYSPRVAQLIKEWHQTRLRNLRYLNTGEYIRPLTIKTPQEMIKTIWTTNDTPEHILPAVLNSVWKASDGTIGIVLANTTGQPRKVHYAYDLSENGGKVGKWKLVRTDGPEPKEIGTVEGDALERTDEVPARGVIVLSAVPAK